MNKKWPRTGPHTVYCDAVHERCSASGFCIISNICVKNVLMSVRWRQEKVMSQLYRRKTVLWMKLRSRRGKFIYNRTYNSVGLNQVSHFSRRGRSPSRLPMKKLESLLKKTRKVRLFVEGEFWKIQHCRLKFIVMLKIEMVYTYTGTEVTVRVWSFY